MADLMRNDRDFQVEDPYTKKAVRGMDPEVHIRRLQHFGEGAGIDLVGGRNVGSKIVTYEPFRGDHENFSPDSLNIQNSAYSEVYDEGLFTPGAELDDLLIDPNNASRAAYPYTELGVRAQQEMAHRRPYKSYVSTKRTGPSTYELRGMVEKRANIKPDVVRSPILISKDWDMTEGTTLRDALNEARKDFNNANLTRGPIDANVESMLERFSQNPDRNNLAYTRRNAPNLFSPQFIRVQSFGGFPKSQNFPKSHQSDLIDLETGNWAKIDPEGYFPD